MSPADLGAGRAPELLLTCSCLALQGAAAWGAWFSQKWCHVGSPFSICSMFIWDLSTGLKQADAATLEPEPLPVLCWGQGCLYGREIMRYMSSGVCSRGSMEEKAWCQGEVQGTLHSSREVAVVLSLAPPWACGQLQLPPPPNRGWACCCCQFLPGRGPEPLHTVTGSCGEDRWHGGKQWEGQGLLFPL